MMLRLILAAFAAGWMITLMASTDNVVVSGVVPNESIRVQVLSRLQDLYGKERITDQLEVGNVAAPANWDQYVIKSIEPNLKQVSKGMLQVEGNQIRISGEVRNEYQRQEIAGALARSFNSTYKLSNGLQVASSEQKVLDDTLAYRTIEFESGSAILTAQGEVMLDEMAVAIKRLNSPKVTIAGNTDSVGNREANIELSLARASAVRRYLIGKHVASGSLFVTGNGPDIPVGDNATAEGRSKNRRIDFKIQN